MSGRHGSSGIFRSWTHDPFRRNDPWPGTGPGADTRRPAPAVGKWDPRRAGIASLGRCTGDSSMDGLHHEGMSPVSIHLKPKTGKEVTLDDLRELVDKTKGLDGKSPILATINNRQTKVSLIDVDATA